jgi:hypothetical protein
MPSLFRHLMWMHMRSIPAAPRRAAAVAPSGGQGQPANRTNGTNRTNPTNPTNKEN